MREVTSLPQVKAIALTILVAIVLGFFLPAAYASTPTTSTQLRITTYSDSGLTSQTSTVTTGGILYVVVSLVDRAGNPVVWSGPGGLLIVLSAKAGYFTATDVYISPGSSNTDTSFGLIEYIAPSTQGAITIGASAVLSGVLQTTTERILVLSTSVPEFPMGLAFLFAILIPAALVLRRKTLLSGRL